MRYSEKKKERNGVKDMYTLYRSAALNTDVYSQLSG